MRVSNKGLAEIASHEAIVKSKYKDSVGVWTIGIGHTAAAGHPDPEAVQGALSLHDVMDIFANDVQKFEQRVTNAFSRALTQEEFDAAVSFDFNTGGIDRATWVKEFNAGDLAAARNSFMNWRKPKEIIPRRQKECDLFFDHVYANDGFVTIYPATVRGKVQWSKGKRIKLPIDTNEVDADDAGIITKQSRVNTRSFLSKILDNLRSIFAGFKG